MMIKLIVGLGNVGSEYARTRHNAGFWAADMLSERYGIKLVEQKKFFGFIGDGSINSEPVKLLKPTTLMNLSGKSVQAVAGFYQIKPDEILVCHDELELPCGIARAKFGGGHGGHNGLRDISQKIGADFHRLRLGIGRPEHKSQVSAYVLSAPPPSEQAKIMAACESAFADWFN